VQLVSGMRRRFACETLNKKLKIRVILAGVTLQVVDSAANDLGVEWGVCSENCHVLLERLDHPSRYPNAVDIASRCAGQKIVPMERMGQIGSLNIIIIGVTSLVAAGRREGPEHS